MATRRQWIGKVCHRAGLALALPLVAFGIFLLWHAQGIADRDDHNEMLGAALMFLVAGPVLYGLSRIVGLIWAELAG